jgi:hypothetical protein
MAYCVGGVVPNLKHNKPSLPSVQPVNPYTNIAQSEVNALGQKRFVLVQGSPLVTLTTEFNELCILQRVSPNVQNGFKICVRQCLPMKMSRMKDAVILDGKVVNITFTPQGHTYIYELLVHESIVNNLPCTYFVTIGVYPSCTCPYFVSNALQVLNIVTSYLVSTCITSIRGSIHSKRSHGCQGWSPY